MPENKTKPTHGAVEDFLKGLDVQQRTDSKILIEMMRNISSCEPVMWGPSIIGFDTYHYKYDSGREGDVGAIGFSPRKANLTIYIHEGFDGYGDLLKKLGKHTTSVSCLYIKKLEDVDLEVLRELIGRSYAHLKADRPKASTVEEYEATIPTAARARFRELRAIIDSALPQAQVVISYAIPAYKVDDKRPVVYISAWKDHVAVYPVPHDKALAVDLKPYIKGKGTLWFPLDQPLPTPLITATVAALVRERKPKA